MYLKIQKSLAFSKPFDTSTTEGREMERQRRIELTSFTSAILKVLTISLPLITLKVTYNYLNAEVYGLWSAITTFFALFAFSDLGLGNGLQTKLSQANGKDDIALCKRIISNTYIILTIVSLIIILLFISSFIFIDWVKIMNAQNNEVIRMVVPIICIIVIPKLISIPISIIQRTQLALQEGYKSDIWNIIGYVINFVFILIIAKLNLGKLVLLAFTSFLPLLISGLNMFFYFFYQRKELRISYKLFDVKLSKSLLSLGILFCLLSILTTIGLSMDTFIVAKTSSLKEAGAYSILFRITTIFSAIVTVYSAPLWGANGEAISRGDFNWVRRNTKKMSIKMVSISTILTIIGLLCSKFIMRIWLGENFDFSISSLLWLSIIQILLSFISPYFMMLNAFGDIKIQIILFCIYTPISFIFKYYFALKYGLNAIPIIGAILYFIIIVLGIFYFSNRKIKKLTLNSN